MPCWILCTPISPRGCHDSDIDNAAAQLNPSGRVLKARKSDKRLWTHRTTHFAGYMHLMGRGKMQERRATKLTIAHYS